MAAVTVVAMAAVIIMAAVMVVAMAAVTAVALNLILLIRINLPEQKGGKIEVMGVLPKTLNLKMAESGEKEEFRVKVIHQMMAINNPFPQV